jgi:hypothetical protein
MTEPNEPKPLRTVSIILSYVQLRNFVARHSTACASIALRENLSNGVGLVPHTNVTRCTEQQIELDIADAGAQITFQLCPAVQVGFDFGGQDQPV